AKVFCQREGFDYDETFSLVVKMVTVRCLISIIVVNDWLLYQLDVNNAFLYGDLVKDFYMKLNQGYNSVDKTKVWIEILENENGLCMSQRKYCLELLYEYGLLAARLVDIPSIENCILSFEEYKKNKYRNDFTSYQKLVGKKVRFIGIMMGKDKGRNQTKKKAMTSRTWNPPAGQRSTKASTCTCKKPTIPTRLLSRPSIERQTPPPGVTMWRRSGGHVPRRLQRLSGINIWTTILDVDIV
ncbi:ribonuclease H-like domain-containing protein, partial [Tanacetum coccineum]